MEEVSPRTLFVYAQSLYGMWVDLTTFDDYYDFMEFCQLLHVDEEDPEFMYQDYENFLADYYSESCLDEFEFDKIIEFAEMDETTLLLRNSVVDNPSCS